jgi:hypothetical protein
MREGPGRNAWRGEHAQGNPTRPTHPRAVRLCMIYIYGVEDCLGIPDLGETCVAAMCRSDAVESDLNNHHVDATGLGSRLIFSTFPRCLGAPPGAYNRLSGPFQSHRSRDIEDIPADLQRRDNLHRPRASVGRWPMAHVAAAHPRTRMHCLQDSLDRTGQAGRGPMKSPGPPEGVLAAGWTEALVLAVVLLVLVASGFVLGTACSHTRT